MNLFSGILFGMALVCFIATGAYPKSRRESIVSGFVFATIGVVLLVFT